MLRQTSSGGPCSTGNTWSTLSSGRSGGLTGRHTYHGHVRDELVCRSLKERSLASSVKILVNDIDD